MSETQTSQAINNIAYFACNQSITQPFLDTPPKVRVPLFLSIVPNFWVRIAQKLHNYTIVHTSIKQPIMQKHSTRQSCMYAIVQSYNLYSSYQSHSPLCIQPTNYPNFHVRNHTITQTLLHTTLQSHNLLCIHAIKDCFLCLYNTSIKQPFSPFMYNNKKHTDNTSHQPQPFMQKPEKSYISCNGGGQLTD